jgi:hypothetical protein
MPSLKFKWERPAAEVFVTGTFDDWGKTIKLDKVNVCEKVVVVSSSDKVFYKFIVDGDWVTDLIAPHEDPGSGLLCNVLIPSDTTEV